MFGFLRFCAVGESYVCSGFNFVNFVAGVKVHSQRPGVHAHAHASQSYITAMQACKSKVGRSSWQVSSADDYTRHLELFFFAVVLFFGHGGGGGVGTLTNLKVLFLASGFILTFPYTRYIRRACGAVVDVTLLCFILFVCIFFRCLASARREDALYLAQAGPR